MNAKNSTENWNKPKMYNKLNKAHKATVVLYSMNGLAGRGAAFKPSKPTCLMFLLFFLMIQYLH